MNKATVAQRESTPVQESPTNIMGHGKGGRGFNSRRWLYSRGVKRFTRRAHNPETVGSTPNPCYSHGPSSLIEHPE